MTDFTFYTPTKIVFGKSAEPQTGALAKAEGATKVLLHYGGGSAEKSGLLGRVRQALKDTGLPFVELGGVVPNPRLSLVREGVALCRAENVEFVLAVGGGSVIDSAKGICYGIPAENDVWDFYTGAAAPARSTPLGVVLTIAAAGSEMSNSSVITDEDTQMKIGLNCELCRPRFAVMNPELTLTLPREQTAAGCVDVMMHTMERYFSDAPLMEVTAGMAESLLRTVMDVSRKLTREPQDYDARAELMWAGALSHNGIMGLGCGNGDWATHRVGVQLSALYDTTHGDTLSILWASWARYVYKANVQRFARFAENVMGVEGEGTDEEIALAGIDEMEEFFWALEMPTSMEEAGIAPTDEEIELMADKATNGGKNTQGTVVKLQRKDIVEILKNAR